MTPADSTTPPPAEATESTASRSLLNEAQLASLTKTEEICRTALKPDYLSALVTLEAGEEPSDDDVSEAAIRAVLALCDSARGKSTAAVSATGAKQQSTAEEEKAEKTLMALIREFQARARQKHFSKNPAILAEYGIGLKIANSRSILEGWAKAIHEKTATDKLPKITEAKRADLAAALLAYKNAQTQQSGAIGQASGTRIDRNALVEQATERRLRLQFAADAEWPHTNPANTPTRREFQLPATRPFIG